MRLFAILILIGSLSVNSFAEKRISEKEKNSINLLLKKQVEAWNEGNLEKFMQTYWKSEKLSFVGSLGPTYGWQATLESYEKGYPDKAAMGNLRFTILEVSKIDRKTIYVIGKFELTRAIGNQRGHFTLVIQKINGDWLIVSDHSSSLD
jgi:hypothetical protein